jgi:DNA-binding SARP family transcriptional activator
MAIEVSLLGPPRVERDGRRVAFDTRKAMALLAHLALTSTPRPREALGELLWPGHQPERARGALRRTLSTLRSAIGEEWIEAGRDAIELNHGPGLRLDVERFRDLAAEGASTADLEEAVRLFAGGFLEGFGLRDSAEWDEWQLRMADALDRELASALRRLVALLAAKGEFEQALPHARRWLAIDPLHEPAHRELIRLHAWSGDRAAALEQYRECVRTLTQELGVPPLEETSKLFEQVNDGTLARPAVMAVPAASPSPSRPAAYRFGDLPLVGRAGEMTALRGAHAAASPDGRLAVIEGEAGIGKTRLATELLSYGRESGAIVLAARCHDDEAGLPYGPVVDLLRQGAEITAGKWPAHLSEQRLTDASLLLPELAERSAEQPLLRESPGAQVRLLEAVSSIIAAACQGPRPGIVFLDDVHAADEATTDVISYLGRRLRDRSLLVMISWRTEAVAPGHRLRRLTADLARDGRVTIVNPRRLDEEEVDALVRSADAVETAADLAHRVYMESEGLPLFCVEYLTVLRAGGDAAATGLPTEVRSILDARLAGMGDIARQVLGAAAAIGGTFDPETVRHVSGRGEEETVSAIDELIAHDIVRESRAAEPGYTFAHQKLRALVYEQTSLARRRLLHARIAATLSRRLPAEEHAAVVASHLRLAGDHAGAAEQYRIAADRAASLHAHADALEYLEAALALGQRDDGSLHERIGDIRTLLGDYAGALTEYEAAAAESSGAQTAKIEHKLGGVHLRRGEWERAEARFASAFDSATDDEAGLRARIQADLSLALNHAGRTDEAEATAREALALAESAGDPRALAQAHNMLGVLARNSGKLPSARAELEASLELARKLRDEPAQAAALNNLALLERDSGEPGGALELTESALRLCVDYGDRHRQAALENNLADLHHVLGNEEAAMTHLKRAVAIFSEVGADEATRLPEIWKLVSW